MVIYVFKWLNAAENLCERQAIKRRIPYPNKERTLLGELDSRKFRGSMLRKLGTFERAMLITNQHAPFNIISVLRLENAPAPHILREALLKIQKRQPFLRARIVDRGKRSCFEALPFPELPFQVIERTSEDQWRGIAEQEMVHHHDPSAGALFRASYIYKDGSGDLVLNVYHTIMDAASGMNLLDELLQLCAGDITDLPPLELAPLMEAHFPPQHRGLHRIFTIAKYALAQMGDMMRFNWQTRKKRTPPMNLGGKGHIATLTLPEDLVDLLSRRGRKEGVTLNSLLNAALMLATNRHLYNGENTPMQTFAFPNLRPYTLPPIGPESLANYISMLRFTVEISGEQGFWNLAHELHTQIYNALKLGDKFSAALMSEMLMKTFTTLKSMRMGSTALNYSGKVPLKMQYGEIKLVDLHGFVSAYDLGPEISSQARLFGEQIIWDFMYLDTDMDAALAEDILAEIKLILEKASQDHV